MKLGSTPKKTTPKKTTPKKIKYVKYIHKKNNYYKNKTNKSAFSKAKPNQHCFILDTQNFDSTRVLIENGVKSKFIHVYERNKDTFQKMIKKNIYGVDIIHGDFAEKIKDNPETIGTLYLDGMGGSILQTLLNTVRISKFDHESVISVTFAARNHDSVVKDTIEKLQKQLIILLPDRNVQLAEVYPYRRDSKSQTMCFVKFVLDHDTIITQYRPHCIVKSKIFIDGMYCDLVKWWCYPKKEDYTWEPHDTI